MWHDMTWRDLIWWGLCTWCGVAWRHTADALAVGYSSSGTIKDRKKGRSEGWWVIDSDEHSSFLLLPCSCPVSSSESELFCVSEEDSLQLITTTAHHTTSHRTVQYNIVRYSAVNCTSAHAHYWFYHSTTNHYHFNSYKQSTRIFPVFVWCSQI